MRIWRALSSYFPEWHKKPQPMNALAQLGDAYRAVFDGRSTEAQREIVLADLAAQSGFYRVTVPSPALADRDLWFAEGRRSMFAEIFAHLSLADDDVKALENAARREAATFEYGQQSPTQ